MKNLFITYDVCSMRYHINQNDFQSILNYGFNYEDHNVAIFTF